LGERVYSKGFVGPLLAAPRVLLHAATLGFSHPDDERPLRFQSALPEDFEQALLRLRQGTR
jgi:23S rRNA pseudouridine1911/1915/1917 synthase